MAFTIKKLTVDEAKAEFKRAGSNVEKLDNYIDTLRDMGIGEAFTVKIQGQFQDREKKDENGTVKTVSEWIELVPDTVDDEGEADTIRAFKRRMNAAADSLKFNLKWKPKGHREGEGEEARFVTDWLTAMAVATKAETVEDGENGTGK